MLRAARFVRALSSVVAKPTQELAISVAPSSGAPSDLAYRTVKIYAPAKTAMQSGLDNTRFWKIDFDTLPRWENPLMGWASSADYMQGTALKFRSKEEAVAFAEHQGWHYEIEEIKPPKFCKKVYADNFKWATGKLRILKTK